MCFVQLFPDRTTSSFRRRSSRGISSLAQYDHFWSRHVQSLQTSSLRPAISVAEDIQEAAERVLHLSSRGTHLGVRIPCHRRCRFRLLPYLLYVQLITRICCLYPVLHRTRGCQKNTSSIFRVHRWQTR